MGKVSTTVLILGSHGFIGRNIKEYLETKPDTYTIFAPTSTELDLSEEGAVRDYLEERHFDVVIHAAVYNPRVGAGKDSTKELDKNLRMFFNLERYSRLFGKMLYFGSGAEFDKRGDISRIEETDQGNGIPATDYGLYKYVINKVIEQSNNIYNLRVFGLFGRYENWRRTFISGACCKVLKGLPITIRQNVFFDYLYIDDFCRIVDWFIENDTEHRIYNVTSGKRIDLLTIADIVKKIAGKNVPVYLAREGLDKEYTASNERLMHELGTFPLTSMEDAVQNLYRWYSDHEDEIDIYSLLYQ